MPRVCWLVPVYLIARYRFPTEWCVVVAAAVGIVLVAERWGARRAWLAAGTALALSLLAALVMAPRTG